jgi:hypothetical protein
MGTAGSVSTHLVAHGKAPPSYVNRIRAHTGPLWPYLILIAVPAGVFVLPDLISGHLLMTGDNAQQNYPLHVLVGSMLRHGQLPFWDPYIFSGSPLLAGFNAGAFYPLIGLFVILPDRVAWITLEIMLFSGIAIGMYVFLRALALSTMASLVAAATFAFSGVVLSQVNHVDMTEGFVALPWMLLAVLHIVRDGRWRWSVLLGAGLAIVILGGAPEAMLDEALLIIAYAAVSAGFDRGRWWRVLTRVGAGAALGLSVAAIQWLPGLNAIANSQRSGFGGGFAASGSYPLKDGPLALVPYIWGGYHYLGEASFFSPYNLPEIGIYLGLLPIVAIFALLRPHWPSRLPGRERLTWYLVGLIGLLLALGSNTPLEHLFNAIPLYGHQRLQSRNMIDVSVAVCVLFAGWLDRRPVVTDGPTTHTLTTDTPKPNALTPYDRWVGFIPFILVLALAAWALLDPNTLITWFARATPRARYVHTVREATLVALGFAALAGLIVWGRSRLRASWWISTVVVFVVADLGLTGATGQLVATPTDAVTSGTTTIEQYLAAHLAPGGRFDIYDPQSYFNGERGSNGLPDYNILSRLPSVGGYASIVNGNYGTVTETHSNADLNIAALNAGQLDGLSLQELLTAPEYFLLPLNGTPTALSQVQQVSVSAGQDPVLALGYQTGFTDRDYPSYAGPRAALGAGRVSTWSFGAAIRPTTATLLFTTGASAAAIRFGKVGPTGGISWGPVRNVPEGATHVTGSLPAGPADGLAAQVLGQVPPHQALISADGRSYELAGVLSSAVRPGQWRLQGRIDGLSVMVRTHPPSPLAVTGSTGQNARATPAVHILSNDANTESVRVRLPAPSTVVRSVAWDSGWEAQVSVNGGPPQRVAVTQHELVQQVRLPAGEDVVTFRYRPPHLIVATLLTCGGLAFLILLGVATLWRLRSRRRAHPNQQ